MDVVGGVEKEGAWKLCILLIKPLHHSALNFMSTLYVLFNIINRETGRAGGFRWRVWECECRCG
jgi:hypothetical protein